jgi:hypothetical protein
MALLCWDAFLLLLFFLQHSGMVRRGLRASLAPLVPPWSYPAVYCIASSIVLAAVVLFWQATDRHLLVFEGLTLLIVNGVCLFAVIFFFWGAFALKGFDRSASLRFAPICGDGRSRSRRSSPKVPTAGCVILCTSAFSCSFGSALTSRWTACWPTLSGPPGSGLRRTGRNATSKAISAIPTASTRRVFPCSSRGAPAQELRSKRAQREHNPPSSYANR